MQAKLRVGLMGGTFNPIHCGHVAMAQEAMRQFQLDHVRFIPLYMPPHKDYPVAPAANRLDMTFRAIEGIDGLILDDCEVARGGKTYTIDTLLYMRDFFEGEAEFFFIIGADTLMSMHTWMRFEEVAKMTGFLAVPRPGLAIEQCLLRAEELKRDFGAKIAFVDMMGEDISSTHAREIIASGQSLLGRIPAKVVEYILIHGLYGKAVIPIPEELYEHWLKQLRGSLSAHRSVHSQGVAFSARLLAVLYGAPEDKAFVAGLLHDCAKGMDGAALLIMARERDWPIDPVQMRRPDLLHAMAGVVVARERYGVDDPEILLAIEQHINGKPDMPLLSQCIYLADLIEPGRDYPDVMQMRDYALNAGPDQAMLEGARGILRHLLDEGIEIHADALETWNWLVTKNGNKEHNA